MVTPQFLPSANGCDVTQRVRGACRKVVWAGSGYAIFTGAITLVGWAFDVRRLTDWRDDGISMFSNTALCAILCGASLMLLLTPGPSWRCKLTRAAAGLVVLIAGLTLVEHFTGADLGIDTMLFSRPWGQQAATAPMRMGPPASSSFVILGVGLFVASFGDRARRRASMLAILPILIASLSLTGYLFGADQLFGVAKYTGIAWQTSTVLAVLAVALMAAIPEHGLVAALSRNDTGGALFRQLIVPIVLIPLALGWLRIGGEDAGFYDTAFGTSLRTLIEVVLLLGLIWWVSNRVRHDEVAASEAKGRLAAIVAFSADAIISKSLDGMIQSWNAGAERLYGYTEAEALGRSILIIIPPDRADEERDILGRLRRGERIEHFETIRVRKDGTQFPVSLTVSPVRDSYGNIVGASKIARDITEQKRAEEILRENEAALKRTSIEREQLLKAERAARSEAERLNIMKDEFLATLSHELRTPLSAILGWSQLLATGALAEEDVAQGLEAIERNARVQTQLIEDLLDMSRIVSGKLRLDVQWTDLAHVVAQAVESARPSAEAKQIILRKNVDPHPAPLSGDPVRLQQMFWNVLSNAIKFTPQGGEIDVRLERANSHLEVSVRDSGIGIDPAVLPFVFERFRQADSSSTRSYGGLGLGLSIVKCLVELHGGTVRAESPGVNQGATFTVRLPCAQVASEGQPHPQDGPPPFARQFERVRLPGVKVLVVDDELDARELLERVLSQCEAEVTTAESGRQGLELVRTQQPHVIVSDIGMPEMDGYEFIRQVRGMLPAEEGKIPAIAVTAFARSEDRTKAMLAGYQVHISKPVEPQELVATVGSLARRIK